MMKVVDGLHPLCAMNYALSRELRNIGHIYLKGFFHLWHLDEESKLPSTREFSGISTMEHSLLNSMIKSFVK
jgi:hypothetical protein